MPLLLMNVMLLQKEKRELVNEETRKEEGSSQDKVKQTFFHSSRLSFFLRIDANGLEATLREGSAKSGNLHEGRTHRIYTNNVPKPDLFLKNL